MIGGGRVPMFRMKLTLAPIISAVVVLIFGVAVYFDAERDPGNLPAQHRARFILAISVVISGLLIIIATARMWYKHLWHDRYKNQKKRK